MPNCSALLSCLGFLLSFGFGLGRHGVNQVSGPAKKNQILAHGFEQTVIINSKIVFSLNSYIREENPHESKFAKKPP